MSKASDSKSNIDERYQEGAQHSHHLNDPMDSYSLADRAKAEEKKEKEEAEAAENKPRPTDIAKSHGNKPSRGAEIDEEIENEEREELKRKGKI